MKRIVITGGMMKFPASPNKLNWLAIGRAAVVVTAKRTRQKINSWYFSSPSSNAFMAFTISLPNSFNESYKLI